MKMRLRAVVVLSLSVCLAGVCGAASAQAQTEIVCIFTGVSGTLTAGNGTHGGHGHGIQNVVDDASDPSSVTTPLGPAIDIPAGGLDVERGSYSFTTDGGAGIATCAGRFEGALLPPTAVTISSDGFYDSIVCGTGFAHDLDGSGTTVRGTGIAIGPDELGYEIAFAAGAGAVVIGPDGQPALSGATELLLRDTDPDHPSGEHGFHAADGVFPSSAGWSIHGDKASDYVGTGVVHIDPGKTRNPLAADDNCLTQINENDLNDTDDFEVAGAFVATRP
jgi:hypothetical protein